MEMSNTTVDELRQFLIEGRTRLLRRDPTGIDGRAWIADYTALMDETLRRIYHAAWRSVQTGQERVGGFDGHPPGLALLAIGGYGRGELCPYSDIDIAFVPAEEDNPLLDAVIKEAFRLIVEVCIDGARLDVAYAYRPIVDCERLDHTDKTALLNARLIAGEDRLRHQMRMELFRTWDAVEFLLEKSRERRQVEKRVALSPYAIEPNLKDGAGALRDIQTALWAADAMMRTGDPLHELEWRGVITDADATSALEATDFLLKLRVWLHLVSGKKNDVLRVEWQDRCAHAFYYTGAGAQAAQRLLADFYRHAEESRAFFNKVIDRLLEGPLSLDSHFIATHQRLNVAYPYTFCNHPELLLAPFALAQKYGFAIESDCLRAVEDSLPLINGETRRHPIARAGFLALVHDVSAAADALTELRAHGLLQKYIPEFGTMLHLAPADPSHELTVGEHSINAVRQLGALWRHRPDDGEIQLVWDGVQDTELLVLATLLHDVGKIEPQTDHSESGAQIVRRIAERLDLGSERADLLAFLVRRHLLLPRVARLRDVTAPGTLREVMEHIHDVPTLKMLYLLSVADTRAVGERTYSHLDLQMMRQLYERTLMALTQEEAAEAMTDKEKREQIGQRERESLHRELRDLELDETTLRTLSAILPTSYILNTPRPTIATHLKLLDQLPQEKLIVDFWDDPHGDFTEMTIVTYDEEKPGLLSKVCGIVHAIDAEILAAQVYTLRAGDKRDIALDTLQLTTKGHTLTESRRARLGSQLREVLIEGKPVAEMIRAARKETPPGIVPHRISAHNDLSDEHTIITVVCDNLPGLLYHITRALASIGLDIHTAKITTWGGRAEDAFYVTRRAANGEDHKIEDDAIRGTLESLREKLQKPV
jgi:[protein-PII] uridylyltransferase